MPTFTIRDVSDAAAQAIRERAAAAGKSTEAYIREWIEMSASQPVIKARYTVKAIGPDAAHAHVRRDVDGIVGRGASNCSQEQWGAYKRAIDMIGRNESGDRETAIGLLRAQFDDVFEVA
jgi:hypothetical protein